MMHVAVRDTVAMAFEYSQDPEKRVAVFRKDHAQTKSRSAMMIQPNLIAI
jgi:hypothetical protein